MAESSREVVRISVNQEKIDFEQNVLMNVMEFNLQADQVLSTAKADTIAQASRIAIQYGLLVLGEIQELQHEEQEIKRLVH